MTTRSLPFPSSLGWELLLAIYSQLFYLNPKELSMLPQPESTFRQRHTRNCPDGQELPKKGLWGGPRSASRTQVQAGFSCKQTDMKHKVQALTDQGPGEQNYECKRGEWHQSEGHVRLQRCNTFTLGNESSLPGSMETLYPGIFLREYDQVQDFSTLLLKINCNLCELAPLSGTLKSK